MMTTLQILFWLSLFLVFYTHLGYGILLYMLVKLKELFVKPVRRQLPPDKRLPDVTLFITAFNEEEVVDEKMRNCLGLDYPADKLHIVWTTDGSNDSTNQRLENWPQATVHFQPLRQGKTAAMTRGMMLVDTPLVVFTDANTMLNPEAVTEIVRCFEDPAVGCVAGEKRVAGTGDTGAAATEGIYWKYESKLKELDDRLYSAVGAAGELFAVRRELWQTLREDTLLDDFVCSMLIAAQGYRIAYCKGAYALETPSADMGEEGKRKKRIAAGGLQSVWRLRKLLNPFRYGVLWFQYVSHRVLRWTLTPVVLAALLPLNVALLWSGHRALYAAALALQCAFYLAALAGWALERSGHRNRLLFIPYYFLFKNLNVFRGASYLATHRGKGAWEKARRA